MKYPTAPSGSNPVPSKGAPKPTNASIAPATSCGQFPIATGPLRSPNSHPMKTMPLPKRHSIGDQSSVIGDRPLLGDGEGALDFIAGNNMSRKMRKTRKIPDWEFEAEVY